MARTLLLHAAVPPIAEDEDLKAWRECRDCGLVQRLPEIPDGEEAVCARCSSLLRRAARDSLPFARVSAVLAVLLFGLVLTPQLVGLSIFGRVSTSTLLSGPDALREKGFPVLALVVLLTLVVGPAVKLAIELIVLFGVHGERAPSWERWLFGWLERLSPWAMVEVFVLGALVAYSRLGALAHVEVGPALWGVGGVMLAMVATDATLDRDALWGELESKSPPLASSKASGSETLLACDACRLLGRAEEGDPCARCGHTLRLRKANSLQRSGALLAAAALLYVPANVLPVMTYKQMGRGGPTTIAHGVIELAQDKLWPLALLVLLASIVVPVLKIVSVGAMLVMVQRRSSAWLRARTRLFRFVRMIGRWSMIDVFMLTVLVGVVRLGTIAVVLPGMGAVAFCAVVVLTMAASEAFDPRLMWDAALADRTVAGAPGEAS